MSEKGFDPEKYLDAQKAAFNKALTRDSEKATFIEFGGKPFSDHHAERVLPGYDSESKAEILRETVKLAEVVMVVNALDVLHSPDGRTTRGRIRGDTQLFYDQETLRMVEDAQKRQIPIEKVVMAVTPKEMTSENKRKVDKFRGDLGHRGVNLLLHKKITGYPSNVEMENINPFEGNDLIRGKNKNLIAVSPGGGSGKFGVLLSEMYFALTTGEIPNYVKFETFPIYQLDANHALNLAFEAASVDLKNKVVNISSKYSEQRTSYDKDLENFELLKKVFEVFGKSEDITHMKDAVDMGINQIVTGITDMDKVIQACYKEICQRIIRYQTEVDVGIEKEETVKNAQDILGRFQQIYKINIP